MKRTILAVSTLVLSLALSAAAQNLFTNGNFEQGNNGFTTDYTYVPGNGTVHTEIGDYSVIYNPATAFINGYLSYGDHTTGSGLMFFADGASPNMNVWGENLTLTSGMYTFTGWAADPDPALGNAATLGLFVNGVQTGTTFNFTQVGKWEEWTVQLNVASPGNEFISIRDTNPNDGSYDDFTMDDLSLTKNGGTGTTPEPSSFLLLGSGVLGCAGVVRRRQRDSNGQSSTKLVLRALSMALLACAPASLALSAQTLTTLFTFGGGYTAPQLPFGALVQGTDGNLYGTAQVGGRTNDGLVYKVATNGTLTVIYNFCSLSNCADGNSPVAGLVLGSDGNFYGTTPYGGTSNGGTVFKITANGTLTTLYSFCSQENCADGKLPQAGLVQGTDGSFYGTTAQGGISTCDFNRGCGTAFKITPSGTLTTLHTFNNTDGETPMADLLEATDGSFYGTTMAGGTHTVGTVFKVTSSGIFTSLYSFASTDGGGYPVSSLIQASSGALLGTTSGGSYSGNGIVFSITTSGSLTALFQFCLHGCADGSKPEANLIQATDGNFYGTTYGGGSHGGGVIYKLVMGSGGVTETVLYNFCSQQNCTDGNILLAPLTQATDGNFYGTTFNGGANNSGTIFRLTGPTPTPVQFVPTTPCRVVDTRNPTGPLGGPSIQGGTFRSFPLPQGGCGIPANAVAYSLNVTVVPHGPLGYLTIWPTGENQPVVSTMNSTDGRIKADAAIIPAGAGGAVNIYASDTTDVILDINGYFTLAGSQTLDFYTLAPCRLIDTRNANGDLGGPFLSGGLERDFPLLESSCIPSNANIQAYSLNVTAVPHPSGQPLSYLTIWPKGESKPTVSTLNNPKATVVANAAIVPAGAGGSIAVFPSNNTDLVVDINGYFASPGQGGLSLYPLNPCRVLDTRQVGNGNPFTGELTVNVTASACSPPSGAQAYIFNATVVPPGPLSYLTLWADGQQKPIVSTLNAADGFITSNMAIVPTNSGSIDAYAAGYTQLLLDISGYFAP